MEDRVIEHDGSRWTTYRHASRLLRVPVDTLRWWVHVGRVTGRSDGRRVWIDLGEAEDAEHARRRAQRHAVDDPGEG